jgi:ATP-binding cassette subfamily B protein
MAGSFLLTELLQSVSGWVYSIQSELGKDHILSLVHEKSVQVDIAFYDLPEYYDQLHRVRNDATYRPITLLDNWGTLVQNAITLCFTAVSMALAGNSGRTQELVL